jgi:NADH-quinone oxidoreductase subunit C
MSDQALQELSDHLQACLADIIVSARISLGELIVTVQRPSIVRVATFLRDDANCQFKQLIDICGVDYPEREQRFEVVYNLLSLKHNLRIRVKVLTDEDTPVPSIAEIYSAATARPPGSSVKPGTSTASSSPTIRTCGAS